MNSEDTMKISRAIVKDARLPWHREWRGSKGQSPLIIIPEDMLAAILDSNLGYLHAALSYTKMFLDEKVQRNEAPAVFDFVEDALAKMDGPEPQQNTQKHT